MSLSIYILVPMNEPLTMQNETHQNYRQRNCVKVKTEDDKYDCDIAGMAVTNTGTILPADFKNSNIKSVSLDNKVLSVLSLGCTALFSIGSKASWSLCFMLYVLPTQNKSCLVLS